MNQVSRALGRSINVHESHELADGYRLKITFGAGSIMHTPHVVTSFDNGKVEHPTVQLGALASPSRRPQSSDGRSGQEAFDRQVRATASLAAEGRRLRAERARLDLEKQIRREQAFQPDPELALGVPTVPSHAHARTEQGQVPLKVWLYWLVGVMVTLFTAYSITRTEMGSYEPDWVFAAITNVFLVVCCIATPFLIRVHFRGPVRGALDYLPLDAVRMREHGTPGALLSRGRFGDRARLGQIGEQRTANLVRHHLLPAFPSLRVIHGLHWPGTEHADLDHVLVVGRLVIIVDSKFWQADHLWWDGRDLYTDGEQREVAMAAAIRDLKATVPGTLVYGLVTVHSSTSEYPYQPHTEYAGQIVGPGGSLTLRHGVLVTNGAGLIDVTSRLINSSQSEASTGTINVPILAALLRLRKR